MRGDLARERPRLRGWSHALAIVPALVGTVLLVARSDGDHVKQMSLLLYGITLVSLFASSAAYHLPAWSPRHRAALRRVDTASIFVLIAGTYTPIVVTALSGPVRIAVLSAIWVLGLAGVGVVVWRASLRRGVLAALYLALGWLAVVVLPLVVQRIGWLGSGYVATGGLLYTVGALVYGLERPRLWPSVFGYHEVFHLLVISASVAFYLLMVQTVVPLPLR